MSSRAVEFVDAASIHGKEILRNPRSTATANLKRTAFFISCGKLRASEDCSTGDVLAKIL